MNLREIEVELIQFHEKARDEEIRHERAVEELTAGINEAGRMKRALLKDLDLEKIKIAESLLWIRGLKTDFDHGCTERVIKGLAVMDGKIYREYYGVKDYAQYIHQDADYEYGYGTKHGYVVFSIGLKNPGHVLTDEEIENCLYYLNLLLDEKSRKTITGMPGKEEAK
jgi:hypothetical protein